MRLLLIALFLLPFMTITAQPPVDCPSGEPPRLIPSEPGRVVAEDGAALHIMPTRDSTVLMQIDTETEFIAWYGPSCTDESVWWFVDVEDTFGWMMESDTDGYLLEPLGDSAQDLLPERPRDGDGTVTVEGLGITFELSNNISQRAEIGWLPRNEDEFNPQIFARPLQRRVTFTNYVGSEDEFWLYVAVYPAVAYEDITGRSLDDLRDLLDEHPDTPVLYGLPGVNAARLLTTLVEYQDFQNGSGVRGIVRYTQSYAVPGDGDFIYFFAGLTDDEEYLVHASFGLDAAMVPPGDVIFQTLDYDAFLEYDNMVFYQSVAMMLEAAPDAMFLPRLSDADALVASLNVGEAPELCGEIPSLLAVDDTVRQALENDPLRVRDEPNGIVIEQFYPGEDAVIIGGPVCSDGVVWWEVFRVNAWSGWVAELQGNSYYLEAIDND